MPIYLYKSPKTQEIIEVIQTMLEPHIYIKDGIEYERIFCIPQANLTAVSSIDPFSKKDFLNKTRDLKDTNLGSMFDLSAELSQKRAEKAGEDPVKKAAENSYTKRTGKPHPLAKQEKRLKKGERIKIKFEG